MQRIGEVESTAVQLDRILDCLRAFEGDMRHAEQVLDRAAKCLGLCLLEVAHDPLEFEHHRQRYEHRRRLDH